MCRTLRILWGLRKGCRGCFIPMQPTWFMRAGRSLRGFWQNYWPFKSGTFIFFGGYGNSMRSIRHAQSLFTFRINKSYIIRFFDSFLLIIRLKSFFKPELLFQTGIINYCLILNTLTCFKLDRLFIIFLTPVTYFIIIVIEKISW